MIIKGFKGFDKEFKCRDFQYDVKKEYETDKAKACESGFHFCKNPLDVFNYYPPATSRFAEVEGSGHIDYHDSDSKVSCTRIKIVSEIGLSDIVTAGVSHILANVVSPRQSKSNTGDQSVSTNTGYQSVSTNTGYQSAAVVEGQQSIACGLGVQNKAKGKKSCWLVLSEWSPDENGLWIINTVKSIKVDGKKIKEDTFYTLKDGRFTEVAP